MAAQERIDQMKEAMRRILKDAEIMEERREWSRPVRMVVSYWDGPGIQFQDEKGDPLLPDFIRDEEQAIVLWNALTDCAPIDPAWFE